MNRLGHYVTLLLLALLLALASSARPHISVPSADTPSLHTRVAIVGGSPADALVTRHLAFIIVLLDRNGTTDLRPCTGTFLSRREVVTAAHCLIAPPGTRVVDVLIWANRRELTLTETFLDNVITVAAMFVHKLYDHEAQLHDVGILRLRWPVGRLVRLVKLPRFGRSRPLLSDMQHAGYGQVRDGGKAANVLRVVVLKKRSFRRCAQRDNLSDEEVASRGEIVICATAARLREPGEGSCYGDDGGPLFTTEKNGRLRMFGIQSYVRGKCGAARTISYFARVALYKQDMLRFVRGNRTANWVKVDFEVEGKL